MVAPHWASALTSEHMKEMRSISIVAILPLFFAVCHFQDTEETPVIFCRFPFVLNLICKMAVFNIHAHFTKVNYYST